MLQTEGVDFFWNRLGTSGAWSEEKEAWRLSGAEILVQELYFLEIPWWMMSTMDYEVPHLLQNVKNHHAEVVW